MADQAPSESFCRAQIPITRYSIDLKTANIALPIASGNVGQAAMM